MDLKQHEKWIREEVQNKIPSLDTNALWAEMEQHVPAKRNRHILFFIIPIGIIAILGLGWNMVNLNNSTESIQPETKTNKEKVANNVYNIIESNREYLTIEEQKNNINDDSKISNRTSLSTAQTHFITPNSNRTNTLQEHFIAPTNTPSINAINRSTNAILGSGGSLINKSESILVEKLKEEIVDASSIDGQSHNNLIKNPPILQVNRVSNSSVEIPTLGLMTPQNQGITIYNTIPIIAPEFKSSKKNWSVKFLSSLNYGNEKIHTQSNLTQAYKDITRRMPGYSTMLWMEVPLKNRFSITGGLSTSQLVHRYSFQYVDRIESSDYDIASYLINASGATENIQGEVKTYEQTTYKGSWYSHRQIVGISLGINYSILKRNRWELTAQCGATSNMFSKTKGSILGERSESLIIQEAKNTWNNHLQLQPYGGMGIQYHLSLRTSIGLQYQYTRHIYTNSLQLNTRNSLHTIGLSCAYTMHY